MTSESFKGVFSVTNPNYKNSDKAVFVNLQAVEIDQLSTYGYKTNKAGFGLGTKFEYLRDLKFGLLTTSFYEKIETDQQHLQDKKTRGKLLGYFCKTQPRL